MLLEYNITHLDSNENEQRSLMLSKYEYSIIIEGGHLEFDSLNKWIQINIKQNVIEDLIYDKTDYNYGFMEVFFNEHLYLSRLTQIIPNLFTTYANSYPPNQISKSNGRMESIEYKSSDKNALII
jgi:hypothetical protein